MALTGRAGVLALVGALVVGLLVPSGWGLLATIGVLLVLIAVDLALAGPVRPLQLARDGDHAVRLGESATVILTVANPSGRRVRGVLRDAWPPSAGAVQTRHRVDVPPGERRRLDTVLRPTRRGDRPAHRVTVRSVGPLGVAARQGSHDVPWRVRVLPPFTSRRHLPAKLARLRQLDGRSAVMLRGQGTEFDSLREYVVGDDVRSIDWRASARAADVMVRTWRPERDRRILLVLDTGRTSAGRVGDAPRLDAAMDAALLLGALASRAGDRVDLLAFDRRVRARVEGQSAASLLPGLVQAMAPIEPALIETDYAGMVGTILARGSRRSLVVLLTALDPAPVEEGLLPGLGPLVCRHAVLLASVGDPRVGALAAGRGDAAAVYDAAAAARATLDRRRVGELLERRGVEVVDAPPADLPPALADRYLALKAAGRL
ncbi:MAG: DUF58 domain-containing protein [Kineosporiaceae bacterium]